MRETAWPDTPSKISSLLNMQVLVTSEKYTPSEYYTQPFYPQKLALTSMTSGGRSVGIFRSWIKVMELVS
jgi:hypothetical protein